MKKNPITIDVKAWDQSNYVISTTITPEQKKSYRHAVMLEYQKEATKPWFRKGKVPLETVEEMVNPGTVVMAVLEEIISDATKLLIDTHPDKRWIGQVYSLDTSDYKDDTQSGTISFHLDVFPEVTAKDDKWTKIKVKPYTVEVTADDIEKTLEQLRSQYAQFDDVEQVDAESLMRLKISFHTKDHTQIGHTKNQYLGKEDLESHKDVQKLFVGKKKGDTVEIPYTKASAIALLSLNSEESIDHVATEILDIKKKVLPDLDQAFIDKTFTKDDDIASVEVLKDKIKETLMTNKEQNAIFEWTDTYIQEAMTSFALALPNTFIDQEVKHRLDHLSQQLGGEKGIKAYLERMGEQESKAYLDSIKESAITSMHKYFILKYIADELQLGIDREKGTAEGEVEKKLYEKLV